MVRVTLIFITLFAGIFGYAQDTIKHYAIGTNSEEAATKALLVNNEFYFFGSTGNNGNGESQIYIVKASSGIEKETYHRIGSSLSDVLKDVSYDSSTHSFYLLTSYYDGYNATPSYGLKVYKLDTTLNVVAQMSINSIKSEIPLFLRFNDSFISVAYRNLEDPNGTFFISTIPKSLTTSNNQAFTTGYEFEPVDLVYNNGYQILGTALLPDSSATNVVLLNYSLSGQFQGMLSYGSQFEETAKKIIWKTDSTWLILCSTRGFTNQVLDFNGWVLEIDTNGIMLEDELLGNLQDTGNTADLAIDVLISNRNKIAVGMTTYSFGQGEADFHLYELSMDVNFEHGNSFGLDKTEALSNIINLPDSTYLLFGVTNSTGSGQNDFFIVTTPDAQAGKPKAYYIIEDTTTLNLTGVSETDKSECFTDVFGDWNCNETKLKIEVFDLGGNLIYCDNISSYDIEMLDILSQFGTGVFILKLSSLNEIKVYKVFW